MLYRSVSGLGSDASPSSALPPCIIWGNLLNCSTPQFLHLLSGDISSTDLLGMSWSLTHGEL